MKKAKVKTGAVHLLGNLHDKDLFSEISTGLEKTASNANQIHKGSLLLKEQGHISGQNIFFLLAEEEAGKFLLLLDAVRCPKGEALARHLKRFNSHIAKGIYAISSYWNVDGFAEVKHAVIDYYAKQNIEMEEDGMTWVAQNPITTSREFAYYVDYVVTYAEEKVWTNPSEELSLSAGLDLELPEALKLANSLIKLGFTNPDSLEVIANVWRPLVMNGETRYTPDLKAWLNQTFSELDKKGLLQNVDTKGLVRNVVSGWSFPMHSGVFDYERTR